MCRVAEEGGDDSDEGQCRESRQIKGTQKRQLKPQTTDRQKQSRVPKPGNKGTPGINYSWQ